MNAFSIAIYKTCLIIESFFSKSMTFVVLFFVVSLTSNSSIIGQSDRRKTELPSVRFDESSNDLSSVPAVIANECTIIASDARFHVEIRRQTLPNPKSILRIYEGVLSNSQQIELRKIVNESNLASFSATESGSVPGTSNFIKVVNVKIQRAEFIQNIQLADWSDPAQPGATMSNQQIADRDRAKQILQPLTDWVHSLALQRMEEVRKPVSLCFPDH